MSARVRVPPGSFGAWLIRSLREQLAADIEDRALGLRGAGEVAKAETPAFKAFARGHELREVRVQQVPVSGDSRLRGVATWTCACDQSGTTASAWQGEDVRAKAEANHKGHVRRAFARQERKSR